MEAKPYKIPHPFRKLNKEIVHVLVHDIERGSTHKLAAESNGITETIFNMWRRQGKIDIEFGTESLCADLVVSLAKIKQDEVKWCREAIRYNEKGHKGAEWTLEHAYWKTFGNSAPAIIISKQVRQIQQEIISGDQVYGEAHDGKAQEDTHV